MSNKVEPLVPVIRRLPADGMTPVRLLRILRGLSKRCYLMDSSIDAEEGRHWARFAALGFDPSMELVLKDGVLEVQTPAASVRYACKDPLSVVKEILREHPAKEPDPEVCAKEDLPPFAGGFFGYFSYEFIQYVAPDIRWSGADKEQYRDMDLMLFDRLFVFDRQNDEILLIVNVPESTFSAEGGARANAQLDAMEHIVRKGNADRLEPLRLKEAFHPLFALDRYVGMVEEAKAAIERGDVCQIVLSNGSTAEAEGTLVDTYEVLRRINPSSYTFYFSSDDLEAAGGSPETMLKLSGGKLFTYPLAGTNPRGKTPEEDKALMGELLADPKCQDEHNMLVDDARNELGAISRIGSVKVERYRDIIRCSHVMHIGSVVTGELAEGKTAADAIAMMVPAGVVSGSPKERGCEIISAIEGDRRGIYGGALGYLAFNGDADICIFFRTACLHRGSVTVRAGGGIVIDSNAATEHRECLNKAEAVVKALKEADRSEMA